jgi:predicted kinase
MDTRAATIPSTGRHRPPALVLMGGGAATGKSRLARALVRRLPQAALLDKDRLLGPWVDRLLLAAGVEADRDSPVYWQEVRPLEYATLEAVAYDHLALGKVAVIDAPLRPEMNDPAWVARVRRECEARGARLLTVWVVVDPETARQRMRARREARDDWKLLHWEEFLRRQPYDPPAGAMLVIPHDAPEATEAAVARILAALASPEEVRS